MPLRYIPSDMEVCVERKEQQLYENKTNQIHVCMCHSLCKHYCHSTNRYGYIPHMGNDSTYGMELMGLLLFKR